MPDMSEHARRKYADAQGRKPPERLSEYFDFERWPEKAAKPVTRIELLAWLMRQHQVARSKKWWYRLWVYLKRKPGSEAATLATTEGEKARGEVES